MSRQLVSLKKCKHPRYSWRVTFRQGDERSQRYFAAKADAKTFADEKQIPITVSIGMAEFPANASKAEELIAKADSALYQAKNSGRNSWRVAGE